PYILSSIDESYAFRGAAPHDIRPSIYKGNAENIREYEDMMRQPLTFYRARKSLDTLGIKNMLHIPFDKREKIATQRFSMPGIPCLYLATTTYGCWIEMGKPELEEFYVSRFSMPGDLKVLNLCIFQDCINGLSSFCDEREYEASLSFLKAFPLVIATSFRNRNSDRTFKSEYIISQLIMQSARDLGIDGVAYLSKKLPDNLAFPIAVNLAILIPQAFSADNKPELYWERISDIELTKPLKYADACMYKKELSENGSQYKSYVNNQFARHG
ncbi:RES domain-containing protein, partial [Mediterraneibacter glycyrrhizinilyticus]